MQGRLSPSVTLVQRVMCACPVRFVIPPTVPACAWMNAGLVSGVVGISFVDVRLGLFVVTAYVFERWSARDLSLVMSNLVGVGCSFAW